MGAPMSSSKNLRSQHSSSRIMLGVTVYLDITTICVSVFLKFMHSAGKGFEGVSRTLSGEDIAVNIVIIYMDMEVS